MLQSSYFPVRHKRSGILLAAAILLAALLAKPNASFPQSGDKVKIGLPDFSISFIFEGSAVAALVSVRGAGGGAHSDQQSGGNDCLAEQRDRLRGLNRFRASQRRKRVAAQGRHVFFAHSASCAYCETGNQNSTGDQRKNHRCRHRNNRGDSPRHYGARQIDRKRR
jgi:hypothetical protein